MNNEEWERYFIDNTNVLKNNLGITNEKDLHLARSLLPKASFKAQGTTHMQIPSHLLAICN